MYGLTNNVLSDRSLTLKCNCIKCDNWITSKWEQDRLRAYTIVELLGVHKIGIVGYVKSDMTTVVKRSNIERHASAKVRITSQIVVGNYVGLIID